jgi:hypothetical protein
MSQYSQDIMDEGSSSSSSSYTAPERRGQRLYQGGPLFDVTTPVMAAMSPESLDRYWAESMGGIPMPTSLAVNIQWKRFVASCVSSARYYSDAFWAITHPQYGDTAEQLFAHGAEIRSRQQIVSAAAADAQLKQYNASDQGKQVAYLRKFAQALQTGTANTFSTLAWDIMRMSDAVVPGDDFGFFNIIYTIITDNAGGIKKEQKTQLISLYLWNLIATFAYEFADKPQDLLRQMKELFGADYVVQVANLLTDGSTSKKRYVDNMCLLVATILGAPITDPDGRRYQQLPRFPSNLAGIAGAMVAACKYAGPETSRSDVQITEQFRFRLPDVENITNMEQLQTFMIGLVETRGSSARSNFPYSAYKITQLFAASGFPPNPRSFDEADISAHMNVFATQVRNNPRQLAAASAMAQEDISMVEDRLGAFSAARGHAVVGPLGEKTRESVFYPGTLVNTNFNSNTRSTSEQLSPAMFGRQIRNDKITAFEPVTPPGGYAYSFNPRENQFFNPPRKETSEEKALRQGLGWGSTTLSEGEQAIERARQAERQLYQGPAYRQNPRTTTSKLTSARQQQQGQSHWFGIGDEVVTDSGEEGTVTDATAYAGAGTNGQRLTINIGNGSVNVDSSKVRLISRSSRSSSMEMGGRRRKTRKTRKIRKHKKTIKAKKSKKSKKSRKSRK